jgi:hypothetical protein
MERNACPRSSPIGNTGTREHFDHRARCSLKGRSMTRALSITLLVDSIGITFLSRDSMACSPRIAYPQPCRRQLTYSSGHGVHGKLVRRE